MMKKRLMGIHVVIKGTLAYDISKFCFGVDRLMVKNCGVGLGSYWGPISDIGEKLLKKRIMTKNNYIKVNLAIAYLTLETISEFVNIYKDKLKCFEKIIKKEFNLTPKELKPLYKHILEVEPRLIKNLEKHDYFRY